MKKFRGIVTLVLLVGMIISIGSQTLTVHAEENASIVNQEKDIESLIQFINSQDPIGKNLLNFATVTNGDGEIEVLNDGGYKFGIPGKYNVTYGIKNTNINKTFAINVVDSQGTLVDMEIIGGNVRIINNVDDYINITDVDNYVSNNIKARCLIQDRVGNYKVIETKVLNSISGGGGGPGICTATYTSNLAMSPYRYMNGSAEAFTYYNPTDLNGNIIERKVWLVEKEYLTDKTISDANNLMTVAGKVYSYETNYILHCDMEQSITADTVGTDKFSAYKVYFTDDNYLEPPVLEQMYHAKIKIPNNLDVSKTSLYKIALDGSKIKLNARLNGDSLEFETTGFPATLLIVEDDEVKLPTILEGNNSSWRLDDNKGITIRSSANFESFMGVLVDGNKINKSNYIVKEGSIIVELSPAYLKTLKTGEHVVTILSTEGNVDATINVVTNINNNSNVPKTGDHSTIMISSILFIISSSMLLLLYKRKYN